MKTISVTSLLISSLYIIGSLSSPLNDATGSHQLQLVRRQIKSISDLSERVDLYSLHTIQFGDFDDFGIMNGSPGVEAALRFLFARVGPENVSPNSSWFRASSTLAFGWNDPTTLVIPRVLLLLVQDRLQVQTLLRDLISERSYE